MSELIDYSFYMLVRECSQYYGGTIILGIFSTKENAIVNKFKYIEKTQLIDPHPNSRLPYECVHLQMDVKIRKINVLAKDIKTSIHFLVVVGEAYGQIIHDFPCFSTDMVYVYNEFIRIHDIDLGYPTSYYWDSVIIGELRDDNNLQDMIGG